MVFIQLWQVQFDVNRALETQFSKVASKQMLNDTQIGWHGGKPYIYRISMYILYNENQRRSRLKFGQPGVSESPGGE